MSRVHPSPSQSCLGFVFLNRHRHVIIVQRVYVQNLGGIMDIMPNWKCDDSSIQCCQLSMFLVWLPTVNSSPE